MATEHTAKAVWDTIATALLHFARGYKPRAVGDKVSPETREVLGAKREYTQTVLKHKKHLTKARTKGRKTPEDEANTADMTLRDARRIAGFGVHELEWKRALVSKNPDLAFQLDGISTRLKAVETILSDPSSDLKPYAPYFLLVLESRGREFLSALQDTYTGACWGAFKTCRANVNTLFNNVMLVVETGGAEVPDAAAIWLRERRKDKQAAQADVEETETVKVAA